MAQSITTVSKYIPYLDQVYKYASRSSVLDAPADLVRETADAKSILVAKTSMAGLGKGLDPGGKIQRFFSSEVMRISDPYLPRDDAGVLQSNTRVADSGDAVIYDTVYARYHWYGKLMVDPITGKGAFHDPSSGRFWSRPGIDKVLTDRDMKYQGAPMRGPHWVTRAWIDNGGLVLSGIEKLINGGQK